MIRVLSMAIAIVCTATVATVVLLAGYLYSTGQVTRQTAADIKAVIRGEELTSSVEDDANLTPPSYQELAEQRALSVVGLAERERELSLVKASVDAQLAQILEERQALENLRKSFRAELKAERDKLTTETADQTRAILLGMNAELAVEHLAQLQLTEAVTLLQGMSEKDAARLLDKFRGTAHEPRGQEIFQSIARSGALPQPFVPAEQVNTRPAAASVIGP